MCPIGMASNSNTDTLRTTRPPNSLSLRSNVVLDVRCEHAERRGVELVEEVEERQDEQGERRHPAGVAFDTGAEPLDHRRGADLRLVIVGRREPAQRGLDGNTGFVVGHTDVGNETRNDQLAPAGDPAAGTRRGRGTRVRPDPRAGTAEG